MSSSSASDITEASFHDPENAHTAHSTSKATMAPLDRPILASRSTAHHALRRSNRSTASCRIITASACCPVFPAWLATMGMSTASTAIWAMDPSNMYTTDADTAEFSMLMTSHGSRFSTDSCHGVSTLSSVPAPTMPSMSSDASSWMMSMMSSWVTTPSRRPS